MAKRDPEKTARYRAAQKLDQELDSLLEEALEFTGCASVLSLNAKIGSKHQQLVNVKERCVRTVDEFLSFYLDSLARELLSILPSKRPSSAFYELAKWYQDSKVTRTYMEKFLERSFWRHYDEYARVKPPGDTSYWIGEKNAHYGIFITPRFKNGEWENDKSEIRRFKPNYFTIGHILEIGFVIPDKDERHEFHSVKNYLGFFQNTLVRKAGSVHQNEVAERYVNFVNDADDPESVPLLIPELRYLGKTEPHKHRLDFCVIDPFSLRKIGFEISPWSSHGRLSGTKTKSVKQVNAEAQENYERDIKKCEAFFSEHDIHVTVFTDSALAHPNQVFRTIEKYLKPEKRGEQLFINSKRQLLNMDLDAEIAEDFFD